MTLCSSSKIDFPGGGKTIPDLLMEKAALHASKGLSYYLVRLILRGSYIFFLESIEHI